jgi:phosphoglucosamine mutase
MSRSQRKLFGTDGIRGRANAFPMTGEMAMKLGRALVAVLRQKVESPKIIIGKDTRISGYMLETALTSGVTSMGGHALLLGPLPTPAVAYMIRAMRAHGGVMISASHNPYQDNGIKVFGSDGFKLPDELEAELERLMIEEDEVTAIRPQPQMLGRARRIDDASGRYLTNLKTLFRQDFDLQGKRIVFDGANGAAYDCGVKLFRELGAEVFPIACEPDGTNINAHCAQSDPRILGEAVIDFKADIGISVDGDADRLMVVDETGSQISGEHLMFASAQFLKEEGRLVNSTLVTTIMSNQALEVALQKEGIKCLRTQVGDRYVVEGMKSSGAILGGENSGHLIFLDYNTTADGLFSSLEVLALLHRRKLKASDIRKAFDLYPQKLVSVKVREKVPLEQLPNVRLKIEALEKQYAGKGRVNVRYSGTEALLRMMIEGPESKQIESDLRALAEVVRQEIGA